MIPYVTTSPTRVNFIVLFALLFTALQVHHILNKKSSRMVTY